MINNYLKKHFVGQQGRCQSCSRWRRIWPQKFLAAESFQLYKLWQRNVVYILKFQTDWRINSCSSVTLTSLKFFKRKKTNRRFLNEIRDMSKLKSMEWTPAIKMSDQWIIATFQTEANNTLVVYTFLFETNSYGSMTSKQWNFSPKENNNKVFELTEVLSKVKMMEWSHAIKISDQWIIPTFRIEANKICLHLQISDILKD